MSASDGNGPKMRSKLEWKTDSQAMCAVGRPAHNPACGVEQEAFVRKLAPQAGLEPATRALTWRCSTIELLRNRKVVAFYIGDRPSFVNSARAWSGFW